MPTVKKENTVTVTDTIKEVREALEAGKGVDIVGLDVSKFTSVTSSVVLCTGTSGPHLKALHSELLKHLREKGLSVYRKSGSPESGWMVIDMVDVVIHILSQQAREYYAIESLWESAPRLD